MRIPNVLLAALFAIVGTGVGPRTAMAAAVPEIQGTQEVNAPGGGGRMLLVYGLNLTKVTAFELGQADGTLIAPLTIVFKGKTLAGLSLPASLVPPAYALPGYYSLKFTTRAGSETAQIRLTGGRAEDGGVGSSALDAALRADLDAALTADAATSAVNAQTVGGQTVAQLRNASLLSGTVSPDLFSAWDDLAAEARVGTGAAQVAAGNHAHDTRYPLRTELNAAGTINTVGNPVDWSQIKGVPAGLADGVDDTGASSYSAGAGLDLAAGVFSVVFGGNGSATSASKSDHNHDSSYYTQSQLNAGGGTVNAVGNPVDWSRLKGIPSGFADGVDAGTAYVNGAGLGLAGATFSVLFGSSGTADEAARSDHGHAEFLNLSGGDTISGLTTISSSTDAILATTGNTSDGSSGSTTGGIDSTSAGGIGVAGHGDIGLLGDLDSDGQYGVWGNAGYSYQVGVYASTSANNSTALRAYNSGGGTAVYANSTGSGATTMLVYGGDSGTGIYSSVGYYGTAIRAYSYRGIGASLQVRGKSATGLVVHAYNYTQSLAVFQYYNSNVARINSKGAGYFNGGTYTSGADFAESVKVDRPAGEFEPGDVMVIDPKAPRQFALSREANSPLVAGVISTKPALVGTTHDVARGRNAKMLLEEVKLGIVGIVPTKVCDEGGEIRIGDLLVSASVPGHARKAPASPAAGTIIGKALGALERGTGRIEVLLMAR